VSSIVFDDFFIPRVQRPPWSSTRAKRQAPFPTTPTGTPYRNPAYYIVYNMTTSVAEAFTYINPGVDPYQLGFLAIGLGGSRAHSSHNSLADWDGIGILLSKKEICHLITACRVDLCKLLWVEHEECPSWSVCYHPAVTYVAKISLGNRSLRQLGRAPLLWQGQGWDQVFN
jgi:hypothetical protein